MNALLMFGPGHGKVVEVADSVPDRIVWLEDQEGIRVHDEFGSMNEMHEQMMKDLAAARREMHQYRRYDVMMSDQTGEECVLYEHEPNCCEKRLWDREGADKAEAPGPHRGERGYGPNDDPRRRVVDWDEGRYDGFTKSAGIFQLRPAYQEVPYQTMGRMAGKSAEYVRAVELNDALIRARKLWEKNE